MKVTINIREGETRQLFLFKSQCVSGYRPSLKNTTPLFLAKPPLKFANCPSPSYLLKVTKFLVKISQFELLVMTEKNIFVFILFLSNISDVIFFFFFLKLQSPPLPKRSYPLSKLKFSQAPPFLKIWWEVQPPLPPAERGGCTLWREWHF